MERLERSCFSDPNSLASGVNRREWLADYVKIVRRIDESVYPEFCVLVTFEATY